MKKLFTIIAFFICAMSANAQNLNYKYPYSFWSNWSVGFDVDFTKQFNNNWTIGQGANFGGGLIAKKQLSNHWAFRTMLNIPGVMSSDTIGFDRYGKGMFGFDWTPKKHVYIFGNFGTAMSYDKYGFWALVGDGGIGVKFSVCDHSTIFCETGLDAVADLRYDLITSNAFVRLGYMYNFGLTKTDKVLVRQRTYIENSNIINERDSLRKEHDKLVNYESSLLERINILEEHDSLLHNELEIVQRENDSLISMLNDFNMNLYNCYGVPFSVLFDNDSYQIKRSEYEKIKAVAALINNDSTHNYYIVGFCDYTGSSEYNKKLSMKRAEVVRNMLIRYGAPEEQLLIDGKGKEVPFIDEKFPVNRRVSFYRMF